MASLNDAFVTITDNINKAAAEILSENSDMGNFHAFEKAQCNHEFIFVRSYTNDESKVNQCKKCGYVQNVAIIQ
jgi:hypothetical protein